MGKGFDPTEYKNNYNKEKCKRINLIFRLDADADIIEKLGKVPNKSDYIRQLIRKDMKTDK